MRYTTIFITGAAIAFASLGCESGSGDEASMQQRQQDALNDPFKYGPSSPQSPNRTTPPAKPNRDNSTQGQAERFKTP